MTFIADFLVGKSYKHFGVKNDKEQMTLLLQDPLDKRYGTQMDLGKSQDRRRYADLIVKEFISTLVKDPEADFDKILENRIKQLHCGEVKNLSDSNINDLKFLVIREKNITLRNMKNNIVKNCVHRMEEVIDIIFQRTKTQYNNPIHNQAAILVCLFHAGIMTERQCRSHISDVVNRDVCVFYNYDDNMEYFISYQKKKTPNIIENMSKMMEISLSQQQEYVGRENLFPNINDEIVKGLSKHLKKYFVHLPRRG